MTWIAQAAVTDVAADHSVTSVRAEATSTDTWRPLGQDEDHPALRSNTEGELQAVAVTLTFKEDPGLKVGDRIQVTGHFSRRDH